jgi:hypothetical protein
MSMVRTGVTDHKLTVGNTCVQNEISINVIKLRRRHCDCKRNKYYYLKRQILLAYAARSPKSVLTLKFYQ